MTILTLRYIILIINHYNMKTYEYTEDDLDQLYDWVIDNKDDFLSTKENYEDDLDNYIQGNFNELAKEFEEYMEDKAVESTEYNGDEDL